MYYKWIQADGRFEFGCLASSADGQMADADHDALFAALAASPGQVIAKGADGSPTLVALPPPALSQAQVLLKALALAALAASDVTASRCFKAGVTFPAAWLTYVQALRATVDNPAGASALPAMPPYPAGT